VPNLLFTVQFKRDTVMHQHTRYEAGIVAIENGIGDDRIGDSPASWYAVLRSPCSGARGWKSMQFKR
jgi:hypothetical protein